MPDIFSRLLRVPTSAPPLDPAEQDRIAEAAQAKLPPGKQRAIQGADSTMEFLLGAMGVGGAADSQASRGGELLNAILPLGSPIRNPATRAIRLKMLADAAPTPALKAAIKVRTARNPRLMAHFDDLKAIPSYDATNLAGMFTPTSALNLQGIPEARGVLRLNRNVRGTDATQTIAHEAQHLADHIRIADRARQAGIPRRPETVTNVVFNRGEELAGDYLSNPWEVRARATEEAATMPRSPTRLADAMLLARDPLQGKVSIARSLGKSKSVERLLKKQTASPAAGRLIDEPPMFGELWKRLISQFSW